MALCRGGGQMSIAGKRSHVKVTCCWSTLRMIAIRKRVQCLMSLATVQDVNRCRMVSVWLHTRHIGVSRRPMLCSRSFVGKMSWTARNRTARILVERCCPLMFCHIRPPLVSCVLSLNPQRHLLYRRRRICELYPVNPPF
jgi:hypothetical protein